jgi:hypothetical protein
MQQQESEIAALQVKIKLEVLAVAVLLDKINSATAALSDQI